MITGGREVHPSRSAATLSSNHLVGGSLRFRVCLAGFVDLCAGFVDLCLSIGATLVKKPKQSCGPAMTKGRMIRLILAATFFYLTQGLENQAIPSMNGPNCLYPRVKHCSKFN